MATESPLIHDGGHFILSTADDARRSSITGTTLNGPNGSGQFYWLWTSSTMSELTCRLGSSLCTPSTLIAILGFLQNSPQAGGICDIGIYGIGKALAGSTAIVRGMTLQPSSSPTSTAPSGTLTPTVGGMPCIAVALESGTVLNQVITVRYRADPFVLST